MKIRVYEIMHYHLHYTESAPFCLLEWCLKGMNDLNAKCARFIVSRIGGKFGAESGNEHAAWAWQFYSAQKCNV